MRDLSPLQKQFYETIFGTETRAGKLFDLLLISSIGLSVAVVLADSIPTLNEQYGQLYWQIEWAFTILFSIEYLLRIWCSPNRKAYIISGYGLIDLLSIIPTYLAIIVPEAAPLLILRLFRILRVFRVLRLLAYVKEATLLATVLRRARRKIFVFLTLMIVITTLFGSLLYVIEGPENGFTTIPTSIYWAIVTVTTVGYGDIIPLTVLGRAIAALGMLTGYAIIAIPTGIITAELAYEMQRQRDFRACNQCNRAGHEADAQYCKHCGSELPNTLN